MCIFQQSYIFGETVLNFIWWPCTQRSSLAGSLVESSYFSLLENLTMHSSGRQSPGPGKKEIRELKRTVDVAQSVLEPDWELEGLWFKSLLAAEVLGPSKSTAEVTLSKVETYNNDFTQSVALISMHGYLLSVLHISCALKK